MSRCKVEALGRQYSKIEIERSETGKEILSTGSAIEKIALRRKLQILDERAETVIYSAGLIEAHSMPGAMFQIACASDELNELAQEGSKAAQRAQRMLFSAAHAIDEETHGGKAVGLDRLMPASANPFCSAPVNENIKLPETRAAPPLSPDSSGSAHRSNVN